MDTFEGHQTDPLSLHKYLYAADNPVNMVDPSGHEYTLGSMLAVGGVVGTLSALDTYVSSRGKAKATDLAASFFIGGAVGALSGGVGSILWEFGVGGKIAVSGIGLAVGIAGVEDAAEQGNPDLVLLRGASLGVGMLAIAKGWPISRTTTAIGDIGEARVVQILKNTGYKNVWAIKNGSGNGIDIVAMTPDDRLAVFEVKTSTTGNIGNLSPRQQNMDAFVQEILGDAAQGQGRYQSISPDQRALAERLLRLYRSDPLKVSGTVVGVDLQNNDVRVSPWPGRPQGN
jgi:hypothetical protein